MSYSTDSDDQEEFNIEDFLHNHSELFTIMGVFGAVGIYLTRIRNSLEGVDKEMYRLAVMASFIIFILIAFTIARKLFAPFMQSLGNLYRFKISREDVEVLFFTIPFAYLLGFVINIIGVFSNELKMAAVILAFLIGWVTFGSLGRRYAKSSEEVDFNEALTERRSMPIYFSILEWEYLSLFMSLAIMAVYATAIIAFEITKPLNPNIIYTNVFAYPEVATLLSFFLGIISGFLLISICWIMNLTIENIKILSFSTFSISTGLLLITAILFISVRHIGIAESVVIYMFAISYSYFYKNR